MATNLQRGKMGLCRQITGCEGPLLLPCGLKSDNKKYCERWKKVSLMRKDIKGKGDAIEVTPKTFERIKKEFLSNVKQTSVKTIGASC